MWTWLRLAPSGIVTLHPKVEPFSELTLSTKESGRKTCLHCGTPFQPRNEEESFCCQGCAYVHHLIQDHELDRYYDLKDQTIPPVKSLVFQERDFQWLEQEQQEAESQGNAPASARFSIQGLSCIGCVWLVEKLFQEKPGAGSIRLNPQLGQAEFQWIPGKFSLLEFAQTLQRFGYLLGPTNSSAETESKRLVGKLALCGAFVLNTMLFTLPRYLGMEATFELAGLFELLALAFASLSMFVGGSYFISRAWQALRLKTLHIDLPIAIGLIAAYSGSLYGWITQNERLLYFDFVALFVFLMLVGRLAQESALERNRNALLKQRSERDFISSGILQDGAFIAAELLATEDLVKDTAYQVEPGDIIPVASLVPLREALFSLEWINGESDPVLRQPGQSIAAGAHYLGRRPLVLLAQEDYSQSFYAQLTETADNETYRDLFYEKLLRTYIGVILVLGIIGGAAWTWAGPGLSTGIQVMVSLLVVSCPCALGVALPLLHESAVARLRRQGLFLKSRTIWPRLENIRHILFDKTGTLTYDTPTLLNPEVFEELSEGALKSLYHCATHSLHPYSRAIRQWLLSRDPTLLESSPEKRPEEKVAFGVEYLEGETVYRLGSPQWTVGETQSETTLGCLFTQNQKVLARFHFTEAYREDAAQEMEALRQSGFRLMILSGDRPDRVAAGAEFLGLTSKEYLGGMKPEQKRDWIRQHAPQTAMMLGDGANDALAFEVSQVTGTPVIDRNLLEHRADFYFLGRGIQTIRFLLQIHQRKKTLQRRVFAFTLSYNVVTAGLSLAALMNPLLAAILMPLSSLISLAIVTLPGMPKVPSTSE